MLRTVLAIVLVVIALATLEAARSGVTVTRADVGQTPVTSYARSGADGPVVVIAHGFAGSRQMMQGYALPLARAGYRVFAFDFLGHGRSPVPMSGDVGSVDGTTRLLVAQTDAVIDAVAQGEADIALLGHSMASDILVRSAKGRGDIRSIVLVSAFSQVIDSTTPPNLLLISGAWEPGLRAFATEALLMVDPAAREGETATAGAITRRAVVAPFSEHVSVLHSRTGRAEALHWLDQTYGRTSQVTILPTGWAILALLFGLVMLFAPVASRLPTRPTPAQELTRSQFALVLLVPALLAPLVAVPLNPRFLPVLVADYLGLHLLLFGGLQLALLRFWRVPMGTISWRTLGVLLFWCALFGVALDRYAANFWPTGERLWIIAVLALGALPYMVADTLLMRTASLWARFALRASFLASLAVAVALDFEGLFFLIMIAPVLVLFYLVFGTMGRTASRNAGALSCGLALGLVLAWALGVSFPLFQS